MWSHCKKANHAQSHFNITSSRLKEVISFLNLLLPMTLVCMQIQASNFKGNMEELEKVRHQRWPEYTLGENVVVSDLVGLLKRKWRNNLILACSYLTGGYKAERMLFVCVCVITEDTTDLIYNMRGSIWTFGKDVFTRRVRAQKHAIQEGVGIFNFEGFQDILTQKCGWPNAAWQPSCFKQEVEMDTSGGPSKHFHSFKIAVPSKPPHVS